MGGMPRPTATIRQKQAIEFPRSTGDHSTEITVLTSCDHPVNKRFYLDENSQVTKQNFQNAYLFDATTVPVGNIDDLARLIEFCSGDNRHILIRGLPRRPNTYSIRKTGDNFDEHSEGSAWAMLDFDNIAVPSDIDPLSVDAIEWVVAKLPSEFQNATYFYQHSGSAGVLGNDGAPMKSGLNVHLFFWLNRRVPGKSLSAYLSLHCLETSFYTLGENQGGGVSLSPGIDPAPLRSPVQAHYIAAPTIDAGVTCRITPETRQGLIRKSNDSVLLKELATGVEQRARAHKLRLVGEYKRSHGYTPRVCLTNVRGGVALTRYSVAPNSGGTVARRGRSFADAKLSEDGKYLTLYFTDEGSPGSWYVHQDRPQIGIRHGDGDSMPLKELSSGAHEYVRDALGWFSEIPHHYLDLVDGYLPTLADFARAKISLVLSPTGSGKTTAAIDWIRSRVAQRQLVLYAAPTIALVRQMQDDLTQAGLYPAYYDKVWGFDFPQSGVIVTTNDSLPRLLKRAYDDGIAHALIFDEIHQGLDRFMLKNRNLESLAGALSKARQSLLLTGTLTDVQRLALVGVSKHALGSLTETDYCCYEFAPFKKNPIHVLPSSRFDSDLATQLENFRGRLEIGELIPRFIMLLDTSKMETYRQLVDQYGLSDHAVIVSRPENSEAEIEEARTSSQPILFSSPLFGLGLNFTEQPAILWARFDHVQADTSQIIQTVNRANRGQQLAEVRIYGNVSDDAQFKLPGRLQVKAEITERFQGEASFTGFLEDHFQLDRVTYQMLRQAERNSRVALSTLVRDNLIQNFDVVDHPSLPEIDTDKADTVKSARVGARLSYHSDIESQSNRFVGCGPTRVLIELERLSEERKNNWRCAEPRLEREMQHEEAGIFMAGFDIADPGDAQRINATKVMRLFGDRSPWISGQYARDRHPDWGKVEAEKTDKYTVLLTKLQALQSGQITAEDLSAALTRNGQLGEAFQAMASSDLEFQNVGREIEALKQARDNVRSKGGAKERAEVREKGLKLLRELLGPLGITYEKKLVKGREVTDNTKPIVPPRWDLPETVLTLRRRAAMLRALPANQKEPVLTEALNVVGLEEMPRQVCESCVFFHQNACAQGRPVDWQSFGEVDPRLRCSAFKRIKVELMLQ